LASVLGVGLGLPAPVDQRSGTISASNILPEWAGLAAGEQLAARLGRPVIVDNDANLGALAETLWGAGRGIDTLAYVKVATGIGAGLVLDGKLFRGVSGQAGEIGHVTLDEHGDVCRCGNRGCLELVAGGAALVAALRRTHGELDSVEDVVALAAGGDRAARRLIADAGAHLGVAAAGLVNLVDPQRLIVGGELGRAGDVLLEPLRRSLRRSAVRPAADAAEVVRAELGDRSEVLGAVAVVLRELDCARPATAHTATC
jgi:predicted NBD/HSP70 family sugar kinase